MAGLKNSRHERFAQEVARGKSAAEAYVLAGYKPNKGNPSTLKADQRISQRVDELLAERDKMARKATEKAIERLSIDCEWVLGKLVENVERAMQAVPVTRRDNGEEIETGEYRYEGSVANRALELLGKHLGMFVDRHEHSGKDGGPIEMRELTPLEAARRLAFAWAKGEQALKEQQGR